MNLTARTLKRGLTLGAALAIGACGGRAESGSADQGEASGRVPTEPFPTGSEEEPTAGDQRRTPGRLPTNKTDEDGEDATGGAPSGADSPKAAPRPMPPPKEVAPKAPPEPERPPTPAVPSAPTEPPTPPGTAPPPAMPAPAVCELPLDKPPGTPLDQNSLLKSNCGPLSVGSALELAKKSFPQLPNAQLGTAGDVLIGHWAWVEGFIDTRKFYLAFGEREETSEGVLYQTWYVTVDANCSALLVGTYSHMTDKALGCQRFTGQPRWASPRPFKVTEVCERPPVPLTRIYSFVACGTQTKCTEATSKEPTQPFSGSGTLTLTKTSELGQVTVSFSSPEAPELQGPWLGTLTRNRLVIKEQPIGSPNMCFDEKTVGAEIDLTGSSLSTLRFFEIRSFECPETSSGHCKGVIDLELKIGPFSITKAK